MASSSTSSTSTSGILNTKAQQGRGCSTPRLASEQDIVPRRNEILRDELPSESRPRLQGGPGHVLGPGVERLRTTAQQ